MPQVLPVLAASLVEGAIVKATVMIAVSMVIASEQEQRARAKARSAAADAAERQRLSRNITIRSGIAPATLVVGTARVSGPLMYAEFAGDEQEYVDSVVAVNMGQLASIDGVFVGDEYIAAADITSEVPTSGKYAPAETLPDYKSENFTVSAATSVTLAYTPESGSIRLVLATGSGENQMQEEATVTGVSGKVVSWASSHTGTVFVDYATRETQRPPLRVQWALGTSTQASTSWSGVSTPAWTSTHRLRGWAYVRTLKLIDNPVFAADTGDVGVLATGPVGVYDPRTDTTVDGTSNPALLAAWFRTLPRADGGCGVPTEWIDWPSVATAANVCDELISVKQLDGTGYEDVKRYECNGVLVLDGRAPEDNLRVILECMAGDFPFTAGMYRCVAGAFRAATVTLTDADIDAAGNIEFAPLSGGAAPPNVMAATIFDKAQNYREVSAPEVRNSTYVTDDGAEERDEMRLDAVNDSRQANYLQGVMLERARPTMAGSCTISGKGADLALLDTVQFTLTGYSAISGKTFEVRRRTNALNGRYPVELREVKASTYTLDADRFVPPTAPAAPDNSILFSVAAVADLDANAQFAAAPDGGRVVRVLATWTRHSQATVTDGGSIQLRWKGGGEEWAYATLAGDAVTATTAPVHAGTVVAVEARAINVNGTPGPWAAAASVRISALDFLVRAFGAGPYNFSTMA